MCTYWYIGIALIALIIIFSVLVAAKSKLLHDSVTDEAAFRAAMKKKFPALKEEEIEKLEPSYSLSRVQLLVWTVIISCSYIYVVFCLNCDPGILVEINRTALLLIGMSLVTKAAASTIDSSQTEEQRNRDEPSEGFFTDILSDGEGVAIHRMQNVIWSVIAITVYISILLGIHDTPAQLPTLDNTLLVLTGLSSVGYLGLKMSENPEMKKQDHGKDDEKEKEN